MNRSTNWELAGNEVDNISGDRRHDRRYEISVPVRWKLIRRRKQLDAGTGRTVDISSGGVLLETDRPLPVGLNLELSIDWPMLLHNVAPLQLVVFGRIVRCRGKHIAIRMIQHEFRTMGTASEHRAPTSAPMARKPFILMSSTPAAGQAAGTSGAVPMAGAVAKFV